MKIEAITLREIRMPLVHFFETSFGRTTERRILLLTVHCEGVEGWGECTAGEHPFYNEESIDTAWYVTKGYFAPMLLGKDVERGAQVQSHIAQVRGHRMARAAVESAVWDAEAIAKNVPLWKLLGGTQSEINCGVSIGIQDSPEQLLEKIGIEVAAGYQRIKVKVKPGWDIDILRRIRQKFPQITLSCDANSAYSLRDIDHLKRFEGHAVLQRELQTSLCLDESILHARYAAAAIEAGACRIINIKLGRIGGFSEAIATQALCAKASVPNWCGGMLEAGIGRAHNIAMSTLPNFKLPGDVSASKRYWKEDIIEPEVTVSSKGTIKVPDTPGRGFTIREDLIEKLTVRKETIR